MTLFILICSCKHTTTFPVLQLRRYPSAIHRCEGLLPDCSDRCRREYPYAELAKISEKQLTYEALPDQLQMPIATR